MRQTRVSDALRFRLGWTGLTAVRPPEVWTLALLYAAGCLGCATAALFPISDSAPVPLIWAISAVSGLVAVAVWHWASATGRVGLNLAVAGSIAIKSLLIANATTPQGELVTAFAYLWVAVYAAHFLSRREAWLHAALISVGFAVAISVDDAPTVRSAYVIVVGTIWVAVTVLSNLTTKMRQLAATDQLTGLLNRGGFRSAAEREHALAVRTGFPLTMVVLDLDGFKKINDWRGHAAGDALLVELARLWRDRLRRCDVIGRHGGDEFVLLLPATDADQATCALGRLREGAPIGWSAGSAVWSADETFESCLSRADRSLYEAKSLRALPRARVRGDVTADVPADGVVAGTGSPR